MINHNRLWSYILVSRIMPSQRSLNKQCVTTGGARPNEKCVFPFKFELYFESNDTVKDTHNECIQDEDGFWCSTKVDEDGYHLAGSNFWGACAPGCPGVPAAKGKRDKIKYIFYLPNIILIFYCINTINYFEFYSVI